MSETITFSITEKDTGANIPAEQLMRRYKVYCREVSQIDLEAKGGFALQGQMLHSSFGRGSSNISALASGSNPIVVCVDKRNAESDDRAAPVMGRWGMLCMPANLMVPKTGAVDWTPKPAYDEINVSIIAPTINMNIVYPIACYDRTRTVLASGFDDLLGTKTVYGNPYYTIANDLNYLSEQKVFKFAGNPQAPAIPNLDKSIRTKDGIHGRFWLPGNRKYMGEIGGIVLAQNQLDPYGQPEFLAETLIAEFDNIPSGELERLLELTKDQQGRFIGMKAQFDMLESLLEAKIKAGGKKTDEPIPF